METITIRPADDFNKRITVNVITRWQRGIQMVMSASSGPKDYLKNGVVSLFDAHPEITQIILVRGQYTILKREGGPVERYSPPFVLLGTADNFWRDVRGNHVVRCEGDQL